MENRIKALDFRRTTALSGRYGRVGQGRQVWSVDRICRTLDIADVYSIHYSKLIRN
jgi:hypothetical protein